MLVGLVIVLALALAAGVLLLLRVLRAELAALRAASSTELAQLHADADRQLGQRNADVDRRLQAIVETMDRRLSELDTKVDRRLESATRTTAQIHERLGKVDEATAQVLEQARAFGRLEQALRPPKARGGFGELLLGNLLADRLPATAYELQYGFRSGERVDAVVKVDKLIPIDAKFPLDNWERMVEAQEDEPRVLFERQFARDLKAHVDAIATKYIRPDEGTYDFALMYLPAEGVYYELVCGKTGSLLAYAHERRIFPVSPTTLYAQLQVISLGLKGLQIEQHAHEVMAYCAQLQKDFSTFRDDFDVIGKHLGNAQAKFVQAEKRLDRFEHRLERASEHEAVEAVEPGEADAVARALDAA